MEKTKRTNIKFKDYVQNQLMLVPPSLDEMVDPKHPVRIVNRVIEQIDLDPLLAKFKGGGTSSYHPRMLLKVVVFAYLMNIYSSRRIESALKENIHFMWISGMSQPDHNTINRFRSERLQGVLQKVFGQVVELLVSEGLVTLKEVYVDGTKIEANANRYTFIWGKAIKTSIERIKKQLEELWEYTQKLAEEELKDTTPTTFEQIDEKKVEETINKINEVLRDKPVSKKVSQKLKYAQKNWPGNLAKYEEQQKILQERNSYSKTDHDATFMRMKEDHMLNGQLKPGYNLQISTQNQFILLFSVHQTATDFGTLPVHLNQFEELYGKMPEEATADAGYGSDENYTYLRGKNITAYIKDAYFDKDCKGKPTQRGFHASNLFYNQQLDCFYCPMGQPMAFAGKRKNITVNGFEQELSFYQAVNCHGCPLRGVCHKRKENRIIEVNHRLRASIQKTRELLLSEEGIRHRKKRPVDVEPVFGNIKQNKGFKRFLLRGKNKVEIEVGLISIAHNLKKWSC